MYGYYNYYDTPDYTGLYFFIGIIGAIALVAWLVAIDLLIKAGKAKGYAMKNTGALWFVGIFATPIVVGLYIASLPDNRTIADPEKPAEAELPAV